MIDTTRARALGLMLSKLSQIGAVVLMLVIATSHAAQAQAFRFNSVDVQGNQRIETATILTFAGITRGEAVSGAQLNDAAQRIRQTGLFESVDVQPQGGMLVIIVKEFPTINRINFEGNNRLSDEELGAVVRSQSRRVYSPTQAEADVSAITQAYVNDGRISATVTPQIIRRSDNRVDLVFEVFEGGVTEIERISFVGNSEYSDRRLRRVLATKQAGLLRAIVQRDTFVADRIEFDKQILTDFYRSRGYIDFNVQNVDVALTRERDAYLITFNVQEGQSFRVGDVSVFSEIAEADPQEFEDALRLRSGVVYSPEHVDNAIARLEVLAIRKGLNFVRVEPRISRNDRDLTLDVEFVLTRGERIFVERIDIEGNSTTLDRVIRRQFRVVEGDPFNPRQIRASAERIRALGYFANADVEAREGSTPNQVIVDVDVAEQPTGSLSFGANYSSDGGFGLVASFSERNFLGRGQQLSFDLSTASSSRQLGFSFAEPSFLGRDLRFAFSIDYATTDNDNALYNTETFRVSPSLTFPVSENGRLQVRYSYESQSLSGADVDESAIVFAEAADGETLSSSALGYTYSYDSRRSGFNPTGGFVFRFGQDFAGLGGDQAFVKTSIFAGAETKVLNEEVTLRAIFEGGALTFGEGDSRVTDRYFLGSRVMRGFEPGGIGPRENDGADIDIALGGNYFTVVRLEADFPLGLPEEYGISGGAFIDYGSVWDVSGRSTGANVLYNDFTPRAVAGLSIFWDTPVGPLRFNFTEPLMAEEFDRPKSFDVTISTRF
ncbi:outer membrane protein assembly factor BamA [Thalassobium sp. R2A62]|uniref:outer membrane protein assembly factor BamA n=1 Tax=Thalassobium sp. R2A62 TaxID=633131 RepID=UPI0001B1CF02|nr:outer membrane protein assembly factor BamA [Thalassobium sp. R2A62]EET47901.1 outer membrane protein assembly complex, YaeT protein [Thalassobium sp. R2A62]